jgi:hypothetical protein
MRGTGEGGSSRAQAAGDGEEAGGEGERETRTRGGDDGDPRGRGSAGAGGVGERRVGHALSPSFRMDIPSLSDRPVGSRFVSQDEIDLAKQRKEEQWKAAYARLGQDPPPQQQEDVYDGRSLAEVGTPISPRSPALTSTPGLSHLQKLAANRVCAPSSALPVSMS